MQRPPLTASDVAALDNVRRIFGQERAFNPSDDDPTPRFAAEERPAAGAVINAAKRAGTTGFNARKAELESVALNARLAAETIDISCRGKAP